MTNTSLQFLQKALTIPSSGELKHIEPVNNVEEIMSLSHSVPEDP